MNNQPVHGFGGCRNTFFTDVYYLFLLVGIDGRTTRLNGGPPILCPQFFKRSLKDLNHFLGRILLFSLV